MITVRFPSGLSVQYNAANFCQPGDGSHVLRTKEGGDPVARIPEDCIVEYITPCRIYNPLREAEGDLIREIKLLRRQVAVLSKKRVR